MRKNQKRLILLGYLVICSLTGFSQPMPKTYFEAKTGKLEYGFFTPEKMESGKVYPLVIYLHGWSNNYTVYLDWYNDDIQKKTPCFVYTPKTPTTWGDWSGWNDYNLSEPMQVAIHVLDSLSQKYPVDKNRLYVYGISMGGEGVFDLLHKQPEKFAAGISICGGGQSWWAEEIAKTPLWMFHGSADQINPPEITERVYNRLKEIGAKRMRYTNYPGYGHEIWNRAQGEPSFFEWMFEFTKNDNTCPKPAGAIQLDAQVSESVALSWNDIRNEDEKSNRIWYYDILNSEGSFSSKEYNRNQATITPKLPVDTFWVQAVNNCFARSELSNPVYYSVSTGVKTDKTGKIKVYTNNDSIVVEGISAAMDEVEIQLISINGQTLFQDKFARENRLAISKQSINAEIVAIKSVKSSDGIITIVVL